MLQPLIALHDRSVYHLPDTRPAVFYLADREGGGILVNSPEFSPVLLDALNAVAPLRFVFYPSRFGARDVERWRRAGARTMAWGHEAQAIDGTVDLVLGRENRFSRTIDFLPMSGRTESCCALRCRNKPGIVFFGPILSTGADGWPELAAQADDWSFENRLIGALGLQDVKFDYALTDDFDPRTSRYGPGADEQIRQQLAGILA